MSNNSIGVDFNAPTDLSCLIVIVVIIIIIFCSADNKKSCKLDRLSTVPILCLYVCIASV